MSTIDLKRQVAAVVNVRWDEFAARHPNVAAVLNQTVLIENITDAVANDVAYQDALQNARQINAGLDMVVKIVDTHVMRFIDRLI